MCTWGSFSDYVHIPRWKVSLTTPVLYFERAWVPLGCFLSPSNSILLLTSSSFTVSSAAVRPIPSFILSHLCGWTPSQPASSLQTHRSPGPLPLSPLSSPNTELMFRHDTDDGRCYSYVQPTCCVSNISWQGLNLVLFLQYIISCHSVTNICIWQSSSEQGKKACVGTKLGGLKPGSDPNSKCSELLFEFPIETWAMPQYTNTTNCRPKFRFPSTRISFAVHTLYRYVIIPNNNILRSHLNKIMKVGSR